MAIDLNVIGKMSMGPWPCEFTFSPSFEMTRKLAKEAGASEEYVESLGRNPNAAGTHCGFTDENNNLNLIITIPPIEKYELHMYAGIVAHEATHALQTLNDYIGEDEPGAEAEAYFMNYIVDGVMQFIKDNYFPKEDEVEEAASQYEMGV
jgi:hypothetical protein